ncbi:hypothetical protein [Mycobacterium sp. URHB0044]|uniref:hypothetical protein n=1 Tax=Mycobacterium sp. URHB0044 TaxID=1380386 RepID=UPI00048BF692|nr:hypothetical protein [Mycobacterium sp. URHB0044]
MGSFGNYVGATMGGSYDESFVTNTYYPERQALLDGDELKDLHYQTPGEDDSPNKLPLNTSSLGEIDNLASDQSVRQQVDDALSGSHAENWEAWNFKALRDEKDALKPADIRTLAGAWKKHGETLKKVSETFKDAVSKAISGKWSGASASAADAASQQVTKTSIYDFTASSDELSDRLTVLATAFESVQARFPNHALGDLIDNSVFDKGGLNAAINDFNNKYHLDGSGHLRNNSDGYVSAQDAIDEMNRINRSIADFQLAVQLFRDTYQPAIQAVATNFPNLPPAPDMKFGQQGPGPGPSGPGLGGGGGGGGGGGTKPFNTNGVKPFDTNGIKPLDTKGIKPIGPPELTDTKLPDSKPIVPTTPPGTSGLTDPVKSAMDTATGAAKDAAGQIADAVKNAAQGAQGMNPAGMQGPPEGVLGLGPQGLGGAGAGAGKGAAGVGGGAAMPRGLASGKAVDTPAAAAAKVPAPATGAGLGNGAGTPGAGAPAAGQRGGEQNGKGHQVNKALRRKKNGKDVIGDAEAVVAVVGAAENQGQSEGVHVDQSERAEQTDRTSPNTRRIPGSSPRPDRPMQVPGQ